MTALIAAPTDAAEGLGAASQGLPPRRSADIHDGKASSVDRVTASMPGDKPTSVMSSIIRIRNGDIWNPSVNSDRTPLARPHQKDIPIPAPPRPHTPLGEAVSPTRC